MRRSRSASPEGDAEPAATRGSKTYRVRFTAGAEADLLRLQEFVALKDEAAARRALRAIERAVDVLKFSPMSCRKVLRGEIVLRELVIPFGSAGYVALFEIESEAVVTILAVRHQREDDYE